MGAAVLRHADDIHIAAFAVSEADAGSDVSSLRTRAVYDEAKDEWVINGTKTWITNGGITQRADDARGRRRGRARAEGPRSRVVRRPAGHARAEHGPEVQEDGHPRVAHRRGRARRRARSRAAACSAARRSSTRGSRVRARARASRVQAAMSTFEASPPARRRAGDRHRARGVRVRARLRQGARGVRHGRSS